MRPSYLQNGNPYTRKTGLWSSQSVKSLDPIIEYHQLLSHWQLSNKMATIFKCIFLNETFWMLFQILLEVVPYGLVHNKSSVGSVMVWRKLDPWWSSHRNGRIVTVTDLFVNEDVEACHQRLQRRPESSHPEYLKFPWLSNACICASRFKNACHRAIDSVQNDIMKKHFWKYTRVTSLPCCSCIGADCTLNRY